MNELPRYGKKIVARMVKGNLPLAFDIYNQSDVNAICPTLTTEGNTSFDHCGDCVSLTFGTSEKAIPHTPVMPRICKTITTLCGHDIGVIVEDERDKTDTPRILAGETMETG